MLAGHQQDVPESLRNKMAGLRLDLVNLERHPLNGILAGKSAVGAGIDALIRQVERSKQSHRAAEVASRQRRCPGRKLLHARLVHRLQQRFKCADGRRFASQGLVEYL